MREALSRQDPYICPRVNELPSPEEVALLLSHCWGTAVVLDLERLGLKAVGPLLTKGSLSDLLFIHCFPRPAAL